MTSLSPRLHVHVYVIQMNRKEQTAGRELAMCDENHPKLNYKQNQGACGGLLCFKYECCRKEASNKTWMVHTHVQPGRSRAIQPEKWTLKVNVINSVFGTHAI